MYLFSNWRKITLTSFLSGRWKITSVHLYQVGSWYRYLSYESNNLVFTCLLLIVYVGSLKLSLVPFDVYMIIFVPFHVLAGQLLFQSAAVAEATGNQTTSCSVGWDFCEKGSYYFLCSLPWFEENQRNEYIMSTIC